MIIPWGTDAPIYHRPIVTIAMIVVNTLVLLFFPSSEYQDSTLVLGEGIHPLQWLTNNFMHAGFFHLFGNMIFLWTFGLIAEGKLGWWRFLLLYLGMAVGESACVQLLVHPATPIHMLGASGVVFGLLAICLVWAPMNDIVCIVWFRLTPSVFDVSILWFVAGYVALDLVSSTFEGALMASVLDRSTVATLAVIFDHTTNAIVGFVV
jgi:membrane associated rhomboid family serine protease